ncbi:hypothetical protein RRF57_013059 [Xylaria bambusicola]|uniref:Uncharacterized protein n=1 Tax=Xylaria bambusicola TaxID=326684 RepID=A0AAN7UW91_9PEZI
MQEVANTRGARFMQTLILDNNIEIAQTLLGSSPDANLLPNHSEALDVFVLDSSVNSRDRVRGGETIPLQFMYEAADCRFFLNSQTIMNCKPL